MSVQGRKHYVNLEGGTSAYGRATLAEIVDLWDVATNVTEDITIPFAINHVAGPSDRGSERCKSSIWRSLQTYQYCIRWLTNTDLATDSKGCNSIAWMTQQPHPPVSKPELSWIVAAREFMSPGAWESQFTHEMNWVSTHQDVWIHWRATHHLWGSWPWPHHERWWNTEGDHTSCPIYSQPPGFSAH